MELILHNNPRSMFSEKVRRVLAYKGLAWTDIEVSPVPPKTDFIPLTGGYRRMPVLQIGADVYCDSALIVRTLERIAPTPTVFPMESAGRAEMIADWADHRVALWAIIAVFPDYLQKVPEAFIRDRSELIPDLAPERVRVLAPHALEQFNQFVRFVDLALGAGPFVAGSAFSVADAACYHVINLTQANDRVFAGPAGCPRIVAWLDRIAAFQPSHVRRQPSVYPLDVAQASAPADLGTVDQNPMGLVLGDAVTIAADDYATNPIAGELVKLTADEAAIRQCTERLGEIVIHFPRLGYRLARANSAGAH
jgi:glutathione S-transferase